jgi:tRNA nucleotidyltransferase/poly(A) polymerase
MSEHDCARALDHPSLKGAPWLEREETKAVFDALSAGGNEVRAVGGAVRNALLGLPVTEVDLATTAVPETVMALAVKAGLKPVPTGIDHGTITVVAAGVPYEVTTLRRDVETFGRHAKIAFTTDWAEDARRRDFTLNALYADRDGRLFDPLGGLADLLAGRVRFIGDAEERIKEDYLRILRFFRFNAYYGKAPLDAAGLDAAVKLRAGLAQLSAERVGAELRRILVAPRAAGAIEALFDYGLLTELLGCVPRLSDLMRLIDIEQGLGLEPNAALRLGALAVFVEEDATRLTERFRLSNAEQAVLMLAAQASFARPPDEERAKAALYRLGEGAFQSSVLIAWARSGAAPDDPEWAGVLALPRRWQAPAFPLRGADIVALGDVRGPAIGDILRTLEDEWIAGGFALDREQLLAKAARRARQPVREAE